MDKELLGNLTQLVEKSTRLSITIPKTLLTEDNGIQTVLKQLESEDCLILETDEHFPSKGLIIKMIILDEELWK